jgi:hypothetical protein
MSDSVELLIMLLKRITSDDTIEIYKEHYSITHPLVDAAKFLANECLIGDDGHPDRETMDEVVEAGFPIFPGEMDSFGWLTGCIQLSRGIIMFG